MNALIRVVNERMPFNILQRRGQAPFANTA